VSFPVHRPRRLRRSPAVRRLVAQTRLHPADLVLPVFVREGIAEPVPISSMPGVVQHTLDSLVAEAERAVAAGLGGLMVFGVPEAKDGRGSGADDPGGILNVALTRLAEAVGDRIVVMADLCLDEFTDHGHCGVLDHSGAVDNDATLERYAAMALAQAAAILAYSAKYASPFYGPFRDAVGSAGALGKGNKYTYQMDPANSDEALREIALDLDEGADMIMVKPGMPYLDIVRRAKDEFGAPTFVYQVSGEYAMLKAAAHNGWLDERACALEALASIKRAGADGVLTYFALDAARWLREAR